MLIILYAFMRAHACKFCGQFNVSVPTCIKSIKQATKVRLGGALSRYYNILINQWAVMVIQQKPDMPYQFHSIIWYQYWYVLTQRCLLHTHTHATTPYLAAITGQLTNRYNLPLKSAYNNTRGFYLQLYTGEMSGRKGKGHQGHKSSAVGMTANQLPSDFVRVTRQRNTLSFTTFDLLKLNG